jgi:cytochrome P450
VLQPVKLSSGPKLPVGSLICVDAYHITNSTELWGNPDEFDAMRFHKLREQPDHENRHQFTSLDSDSPGWGGGVQGCPGRVFASITIKIILAHILSNYEIKLPPGKGKPSRGNMPNGSVSPNMFAHILIRERKEKMK